MQRRISLTKLLTYILEASKHIIDTHSELKKEVVESGLFLDELRVVFPKLSEEVLLKDIETKLAEYSSTATIVNSQLEDFVAALDHGDIENDESGTFNFMREVWLGDTYGVAGIEALKELAKDLKNVIEVEYQEEQLLKTMAASIALKK